MRKTELAAIGSTGNRSPAASDSRFAPRRVRPHDAVRRQGSAAADRTRTMSWHDDRCRDAAGASAARRDRRADPRLEICARASAREHHGVVFAVTAALPAALVLLSRMRLCRAPFPGQYSVDPAASRARRSSLRSRCSCCSCRATNSAQRHFRILLLSSLYGVCLLLVGGQLPDAVPGPRADVAAGVRAGAASPSGGQRAPRRRSSTWSWAAQRRAIFLMGVSLLYGGSGIACALGVCGGALRSADTMAQRGRRRWWSSRSSSRRRSFRSMRGRRTRTRRGGSGHRVHGDDHQGGRAAGRACGCSATHRCRRRWPICRRLLPLLSIVWGNLAAMRQTRASAG